MSAPALWTHAHDLDHAAEAPVIATEPRADGVELPIPATQPMATVAAFALAGPGSAAMAYFTCLELMYINGYQATAGWNVLLGAWAVYGLTISVAIWLSHVRGEWGHNS